VRGPAALLPALVLALAPATAHARTRQYWIAAVPVRWNVVQNELDAISGMRYSAADTVFPTVTYRRYTRGFRRPMRVPADRAAGVGRIPGPMIRARVGDDILVHFKNLDTATHSAHSMHFHGVEYPFGSDGSYIPGFSGRGADVRVGQTFTYHLHAGRQSAGVWPYHDHSPSMDASIAGGLFGELSILRRHQRAPDHEFVVFLAALHGFETIDGHSFIGNTPVFHARLGDVVQWDVLTLGDEFHTFHVHGHRWIGPGGRPQDTRTIGPAESFAVRWREDRVGTWLYHCHVETHMMMGMIGLYRVRR
jgi:manganese oxidase